MRISLTSLIAKLKLSQSNVVLRCGIIDVVRSIFNLSPTDESDAVLYISLTKEEYEANEPSRPPVDQYTIQTLEKMFALLDMENYGYVDYDHIVDSIVTSLQHSVLPNKEKKDIQSRLETNSQGIGDRKLDATKFVQTLCYIYNF